MFQTVPKRSTSVANFSKQTNLTISHAITIPVIAMFPLRFHKHEQNVYDRMKSSARCNPVQDTWLHLFGRVTLCYMVCAIFELSAISQSPHSPPLIILTEYSQEPGDWDITIRSLLWNENRLYLYSNTLWTIDGIYWKNNGICCNISHCRRP